MAALHESKKLPIRLSASAPGKVILFGEHAVVHGVEAVASALTNLCIVTDIVSMNQIKMKELKFFKDRIIIIII